MNITQFFKDSWEIYTKNLGAIILAALIAGLLGAVTLGILAPVLYTGFMMLYVRAKRGETPETGKVFALMNKWYIYLFAAIIMSIIMIICPAVLVLLAAVFRGLSPVLAGICTALAVVSALAIGITLGTWWIYALLFIADKNLPIMKALAASKDLIVKKGFWIHLGFLVLCGIVIGVGQIIPLLGGLIVLLFTGPIGCGAIACAFEDETKEIAAAPAA